MAKHPSDPYVRAVQEALIAHGFDPGEPDGILGRLTRGAIQRFQRANGLEPDGIVGRHTSPLLFASAEQPPPPERAPVIATPWYLEAERLKGTQEIPGRRSNPVILDWADGLGLDYGNDDIPWCGLFVAHCIASSLPDEPLPGNVLLARAWGRFGRPISPRLGALLVFWRGQRSGWSGHVGFYAGEDATAYHVLGGNQSNAVNVARISKQRLLEARWPSTAAQAETARVHAAPAQPLSHNEA